MNQQAQFQAALADLPRKHRVWLESADIELWAYYGLGILLNDAQVEHLRGVIEWPPGSIHVWRWANRTGKTTGLDALYAWAGWYKWRFKADMIELWMQKDGAMDDLAQAAEHAHPTTPQYA